MAAYLLRNWQLGVLGFLTISGLTSRADRTLAQITPDATLGGEASVVTPGVDIEGQAADRIDGGATRGINLFHSFDQFNVEDGQRVYFANPIGIENILTRVTGTNASSILGTLGVTSGNANLFVINPNGIIFGQNARLDVRGSFIATTANAVELGETGFFSASEPATSNLLTVRPSALFFNNVAAQAIVNQSPTQSLSGETNPLAGDLVGLQVPTDQTLALVGGDVILTGGKLTAFGGRIELGSVAGNSLVSLTPIDKGWVFGYEGVQNFNDIQLSQGTTLDASGLGGGDIQVQGRHVTLTNESKIFAETLGNRSGGNIFIRAEQLNIEDGSIVDASTFGSGRGGNVTIDTKKLLVQGGVVSTGTFGQGDAGNLLVTASESVEVIGTVPPNDRSSTDLYSQILNQYLPEDFPRPSNLSTPVFLGDGAAGDLTIVTGKLIVREGAVLSTGPLGGLVVRNGEVVSVDPIGQGQGGDLKVTASNSVELIGTSPDGLLPSGLFSQSLGNSASGNLTITTGKLLVRDGAVVSAATFGQGQGGNLEVAASDSVELIGTSPISQIGSSLLTHTRGAGSAGDLRITTGKLIVRDGAFVFAGTQGQGQGGNLEVSASDLVELSGTSRDSGQTTGLFTVTQGAGDAGDLTIEARQLAVRYGAEVSVSSEETGDAGNLDIASSDLLLDNQGYLRASTASGLGGNIELQVQDLILMRRDSLISVNAQNNGSGGNVTINAPFLVAIMSENSDIIANAEGGGRGGNINITTQGIYGFEYRPQLTPKSDINASSRFGVNGIVNVNTPDVDPSRGLAELPIDLVDATGLIDSSCTAGQGSARNSRFTVTGRGGLPPNPTGSLSSDTVWNDLRLHEQPPKTIPSAGGATQENHRTTGEIVEAQGWVKMPDGKVVLVAQIPSTTIHKPWLTSPDCQDMQASAN